MNKISLILPDLHHKVDQADRIIKYVGADEIIFLGDWADDFDDTPEMVEKSAKWFVNFVNKPNHIALVGNHEMHYAYPYRTFRCSGYEQWKYNIINDIVSKKDWDKMKWYHVLDDKFLLTHAGLHNSNFPKSIKDLKSDRPAFFTAIKEYLDQSIIDGLRKAANNEGSWIFNAGASRGGFNKVGGLTWCDFDLEIGVIKGLNTIVGHTPGNSIRWRNIEDKKKCYRTDVRFMPSAELLENCNDSYNLCLDVQGNMHYAIWNGKELKIGNYRDL